MFRVFFCSIFDAYMVSQSSENQNTPFYPEFRAETERLHFAMEAAGVGVWEVNMATNEVEWDDRCRDLFGLAKDNRIPYIKAIQYIHPDDIESVNTAVQKALKGENNGKYDMRYRTIGADDGKLRWVHFSGNAYFDEKGNVTRFGGIAQDITGPTLALLNSQRALQQSEYRFRTVIESAPAGIAVFIGRDLIIDMPNQVFVEILGKGPDIAGKPLSVVLPELQNQPFLQILDNVFTTGEIFRAYDAPADIVHNGKLTTRYFNITFSPLFDNEGKVYAILDISIDVTEAALNRKKLEEAQKVLEDAVELAKLATWVINPEDGRVEYSGRMKSWLGISEEGRSVDRGIDSLPANQREEVKKALLWAMNPKSGGVFDLEYGIINQQNGRERVIHSQGRAFFNESGKPVKLIGVSQDVTQQRNIRLALEHQVQLRTEELDAANEELHAINEELHATNDELARLNDQLELSNENLQQFAHVASHDLKEPVRKIKTFLGLIEADPATTLSTKTKSLLERVYVASDRIFAMINGVLAYSTVDASGHAIAKVDLQKIITQVTQDLEVLVEQKKVTIDYGNLPEIEGAEVLLYQLFLNLVSNSIKFSKPDVPPVIKISSEPIDDKFTKITVEDNGLGFAPHQADRIFNMFSRLHSKDKYEGTGLGLALCKKIVQRHGGSIEASGVLGKGAVFIIRLPLRQTHNII